jgi:hypothetical protein
LRGTQSNGRFLSHLTHVLFHFRTLRDASQNSGGKLIGPLIEMPLDFPFDSAKGARILSQPLFPRRLTNLRRSAKLIHNCGWGTNHRSRFLETNFHGDFLFLLRTGQKATTWPETAFPEKIN